MNRETSTRYIHRYTQTLPSAKTVSKGSNANNERKQQHRQTMETLHPRDPHRSLPRSCTPLQRLPALTAMNMTTWGLEGAAAHTAAKPTHSSSLRDRDILGGYTSLFNHFFFPGKELSVFSALLPVVCAMQWQAAVPPPGKRLHEPQVTVDILSPSVWSASGCVFPHKRTVFRFRSHSFFFFGCSFFVFLRCLVLHAILCVCQTYARRSDD